MIFGAEIASLLMGIWGLCTGKLTLSKQCVVCGTPARLLSLVGCAPIPLTYVVTQQLARRGMIIVTPVNGSPSWTMIGLEAGVLIACVAMIYLVGFMFAESSRTYTDERSRLLDSLDAQLTSASSGSNVKRIVLVFVVGISVFCAGIFVFGFWPDIKVKLGFPPSLNETAESDIDEIPAAPPLAGPVPESLLPASWQPRVDRMLDFNRRTLSAAYEKVGKRSPDWDESALAALELTARQFSFGPDPQAQPKDIRAATQNALEAGCDDPLILYVHFRFADKTMSADEIEQGFARAAKAMQASAYPPFRRASAIQKAMERNMSRAKDPVAKAELIRQVQALLWLMTVSARKDERCHDLESIWYDFARTAYKAHKQLDSDPRQAWLRVNEMLVTAKPLEATRLLLKGEYHIEWSWEARGNGYANTVSRERSQTFNERLTIAREALEESWALSPGRPATFMLTVEMGQSRGRAEMEKWFDRAIQYDPTVQVCGKKLDWLHPKWHGSTEEMLAFGRACRDSKNWERGFPQIMVEAHRRIADMLPTEAARADYFRQPEVAADIVYVYAKFVERHPEDITLRSRYAYYCYLCGYPRRAHKQFEQIGDKPWWDDTFTEAKMKQARANAAKHAADQPKAR